MDNPSKILEGGKKFSLEKFDGKLMEMIFHRYWVMSLPEAPDSEKKITEFAGEKEKDAEQTVIQ